MNLPPKISVLMPAYNAEKYIKEAIESILNQTFVDFELLIINDGSTDNTEKEILSFTDGRIIYVKNETNLGLANSLNKGIKLAKGKYIARMDSDDISLPSRLEVQVDFLDKYEDIALCSTGLQMFGANDKLITGRADFEEIKIDLLFSSAIGHASSMFRKDVFTQNNLFFNQYFFPAEDYELWTRAVFYCKMTNLPVPYYLYRIYEHQVTATDPRSAIKSEEIQKNYLQNALNLSEKEASFFAKNNSFPMSSETIMDFRENYNKIIQANQKQLFFDSHKLEKTLNCIFQNKLFALLSNSSIKFVLKNCSLLFLLRMDKICKLLTNRKIYVS
jgi:glycosyltransferase involved in cell wall biosynthesis